MQPFQILLLIAAYFGVLLIISYFTGKSDSNDAFFRGENKSPWYLVAFGMIGSSLSGVTFMSVPGWVQDSQFTYMQVVSGYFFGYLVITYVLLPLYYRLNVTTIYEYLEQRFGRVSHKTGAIFFFISRMLGSAFRLFLVAAVLQAYVFDTWNVPFVVTVCISVLLIWLYTARGGIKTIVWTDTFQTLFMLSAVGIAIYIMLQNLDWSMMEFLRSEELKTYSKAFQFEDSLAKDYFWKSFFGGMFITICMTGLDQDMMQKSLTCKNLKDAQKNVMSYSMVFVPVNLLFLGLGALLFIYANKTGMVVPEKTDLLFPEIAINSGLSTSLAVLFLLGLIAAAYSSADGALTALTTSFCIDFLDFKTKSEKMQKKVRKQVHIGMSIALAVIIIIFNYLLDSSVIDTLLKAAAYTYGPLLGLFAFGIFTKWRVKDKWVLLVSIISVGITALLDFIPPEYLGGYQFNYELLVVNGALTFLGLILIRIKQD